MPDGPIVREPTPEEDRIRPVPLVGVALGSLVAGFLVVWALGQSAADAPPESDRGSEAATRKARARSSARSVSEPATPAGEPDGTADEPSATPVAEPAGAAGEPGAQPPAAGSEAAGEPGAQPSAGGSEAASAADGTPQAPAPAPVPPPRAPAPAGVALGQAFYFRCWEAGQDEPVEGECDRLPLLEERVREQLGEIATCASGSSGTLSIGLEVQFASRRSRWWSGRSTTITPVEPLIQCVRTRLADTSLDGIEHRYQKYTLFLPVQLP